ncbi:hypothetical protein GCM10010245_20970 [Streptomyces spectabilis]|nr:hypothetical protein GCM10010245_20970 [Streptomyces spectabilis]
MKPRPRLMRRHAAILPFLLEEVAVAVTRDLGAAWSCMCGHLASAQARNSRLAARIQRLEIGETTVAGPGSSGMAGVGTRSPG